MAKQSLQLWEFNVTGTGNVTADMLRYDSCWPARQEDASHMEYSGPREPTGWRQNPRTVTLRGIKEPTVARWATFGWSVTNVRKVG